MLELSMSAPEQFDQENNRFIIGEPKTFQFEHSLKSLFEWEGRWKKPFLTNAQKTGEEILDYYQCMAIGEKPPIEWYTTSTINSLNAYLKENPTATVVHPRPSKDSSSSYISAEVIYAMMAMNGVPFTCDEWNLNRLLMLLAVIGEKSRPPEKRSRQETIETYRDINQQRLKELNTKG